MRALVLIAFVGLSGCTLLFGNNAQSKNDDDGDGGGSGSAGSGGSAGGGGGQRDMAVGVGATIGPAGGTLQSADGVLTIDVPPGALTSGVPFTIGSSIANPFASSTTVALGSAYEIEPSGTTFAVPLTLTFKLPSGLPSQIVVGVSTGTAGHVEALVSNVDVTAQTVTGFSSHLSTFGLTGGQPQDVACSCQSDSCFGSCCKGTLSTSGDSCSCTSLVEDPTTFYSSVWQQWDCFDSCAGVAGPELTTACTACVANCFRQHDGVVLRATPTSCSGQTTNDPDPKGFVGCFQACHAQGLDKPTSVCVDAPPDGGTVGPACDTIAPYCVITLSGAVSQTYACDVHTLGIFDDTANNSRLESTWNVARNPTMADPRGFSLFFFMLPSTPTSGSYTFGSANVLAADGFVSTGTYDQLGNWAAGPGSNLSTGLLALTCVQDGTMEEYGFGAEGHALATFTGDLGTINAQVDFLWTAQ